MRLVALALAVLLGADGVRAGLTDMFSRMWNPCATKDGVTRQGVLAAAMAETEPDPVTCQPRGIIGQHIALTVVPFAVTGWLRDNREMSSVA